MAAFRWGGRVLGNDVEERLGDEGAMGDGKFDGRFVKGWLGFS
jgi:hypothetical protein